MRIGHGYDVHRLVQGRRLILGGQEIPYELGLLGHSDADVLTHAVMDALLGAAGLWDIGHAFPDTDPAYEGISSLLMLSQVMEMLKLAPYIPHMRRSLAGVMGVDENRINVKATTEEGLGFTGIGQGMAAHAVALLEES